MTHAILPTAFACALGLAACAPRAAAPPSAPSPPVPAAGTARAGAPPPDAPGHVSEPTATDPPLEERDSRQLGRTWGWAAVGVGASAAVLALGTSWVMLDDLSRRGAHCDSAKVCTSVGASANDGLSSIAPVNTTSWIVAGAALGAGAFLLFTHPTDRSKGLRVGVAPTAAGVSAEAWGSF